MLLSTRSWWCNIWSGQGKWMCKGTPQELYFNLSPISLFSCPYLSCWVYAGVTVFIREIFWMFKYKVWRSVIPNHSLIKSNFLCSTFIHSINKWLLKGWMQCLRPCENIFSLLFNLLYLLHNISGSSSSFLQFPRKVVSYLGDFILEIVFFFLNSKTDIRMGVLVQSLIRQEQFRLRMNRRGRTFAWDQPEREWAGLKWPSCLGWFGSSWLSTENAQGSGWLLFSNQTNQDWALSDSCPPSIAEGKESALTCPWWVLLL